MFKNIYAGKRVIVTGHTGFKGAWLSLWLQRMQAEVYGIANAVPTNPSLFVVAGMDKAMTSYMEDIRQLEKMKSIFREVQPDFVFHLAAQPIVKSAYEDPVGTITTNVNGTVHLLEALRTLRRPCCAVMITSDKCYDNVEWVWGYKETDRLGGKDPYSASKGAAELMIKTYFHSYFKKEGLIKIAPVRAGNVIGGGDWADSRIVPDCFRAWSRQEKVVIRRPEATRPWQHVLEPLSGYLRAGEMLAGDNGGALSGEAFNFGPPADQHCTVLDLLHRLAVHWGAKQDELLEVMPSDFHEAGLLKLNCDKALYYLGWRPALHFEETAAFTSDWYKTFYQQGQTDMRAFTEKQINAYADIAKNRNLVWAQ